MWKSTNQNVWVLGGQIAAYLLHSSRYRCSMLYCCIHMYILRMIETLTSVLQTLSSIHLWYDSIRSIYGRNIYVVSNTAVPDKYQIPDQCFLHFHSILPSIYFTSYIHIRSIFHGILLLLYTKTYHTYHTTYTCCEPGNAVAEFAIATATLSLVAYVATSCGVHHSSSVTVVTDNFILLYISDLNLLYDCTSYHIVYHTAVILRLHLFESSNELHESSSQVWSLSSLLLGKKEVYTIYDMLILRNIYGATRIMLTSYSIYDIFYAAKYFFQILILD